MVYRMSNGRLASGFRAIRPQTSFFELLREPETASEQGNNRLGKTAKSQMGFDC
jgi:hypothetical protein